MIKINLALTARIICIFPILGIYAENSENNRDNVVKGTLVTGFNYFLSEELLWNLGRPFGKASFNLLFQHNLGVANSLPFILDTPKKALAVLNLDFNYLDAIKLSMSKIDYKFINLLLRD